MGNTYDPNVPYHSLNVDEVLERLDVDPNTGLTENEVNARIEHYGQNNLPEPKSSIWKLYFAPFLENGLVIVYLIAGLSLLILSIIIPGDEGFASFTFFIVLFNAVLAIFQQYRAQKRLDALKGLTQYTSKVFRDGKKKEILATSLVPGDILLLDNGDRIPADARLIAENNLQVNESSVTGESLPVSKDIIELSNEVDHIQDKKNMVFMDTFVTAGNARGVIVATGRNTEIGTVSKQLGELAVQDVPLKKKINTFAKYLGILVVGMFLFIWIYRIIFRSINPGFELGPDNILTDLFDAINLGVKFMPVNIVLLVTIILFTGVLALGIKGVITRNLNAIETLGRISVVCTDKTGTLTENEMTVQQIYTSNNTYSVSGIGYDINGKVLKNGNIITKRDSKTLEMLGINCILNNNAEIMEDEVRISAGRKVRKEKISKVVGDPLEGALIVLSKKLEISKNQLLERFDVLKEFPFDSKLKRMTTVSMPLSKNKTEGWIALTKGAPEVIISLSKYILEENQLIDLSEEKRQDIETFLDKWAGKGYRLLAFAYKDINPLPNKDAIKREEVERDLVFLGMVAMMDPPRDGVDMAVKACQSAGVKVIMVTGDHPRTAKTIGTEIGIYDEGDDIVSGDEIRNIDSNRYKKATVFARVTPGDKEQIVTKYQENEKVVAMTGDGVNDALALGMADVGIAMGITGTDLAKDAADIIISDDSFNTIERGIREGRGLFAKIRATVYFFVYANLAEALVLFITSLFNPHFTLFDNVNWQIYLIYGISHAIPPLGLTFDRTPKDIMREKPRNEEEIFNKNVLILMAVHIGTLMVAMFITTSFVYTAFQEIYSTLDIGTLTDTQIYTTIEPFLRRPRTIALAVVIFIEIITIFSIRRKNKPVWKTFNKDMSPFLLFLAIASIAAFVVHCYLPMQIITEWFGLAPLSGADWLLILLISLPALPIIELTKWLMRTKFDVHF